jgi:phenylpyruvate tautomerase PptA (4-oxalocrotonate tautomerase family)
MQEFIRDITSQAKKVENKDREGVSVIVMEDGTINMGTANEEINFIECKCKHH